MSHWKLGIPSGSDGKEFSCSVGDLSSIPGLGRSPEKGMQPTPLFLPGEFHGQRNLMGCNPWVAKSQTQLNE